MVRVKTYVLLISVGILASETLWIYYSHEAITAWLQKYFFLGGLVFLKGIWKRLVVLKFITALKAFGTLFINLGKLLLLKLFKTLGLRYGVFFSQQKWRGIRSAQIVFLRKGKTWSRKFRNHWQHYIIPEKIIVIIAFLPLFILQFLLGFSFDITRKTLVKKSQEAMALNTAKKAAHTNAGFSAWIRKLDQKTIQKIKQLTNLHSNNK